ncbi:MAG: glycoside hydrolase family 95-like protein [Verrucomicrobiota bacterium]
MRESNTSNEPRVDWPDFLGRCDLRWDEGVRDTWGECAFIADGQTGASIYGLAGEPGALRWQLGRTDVTAHHRLPEDWCVPRVPIGDIILRTPGRVIGSSMRLHLWDAEASGHVQTTDGIVRWGSFVEREARVLVVELKEEFASANARLEFQEEWSISHRAVTCGVDFEALPPDQRPPKPWRDHEDEIRVVVQPLTEHGAHATAWTEKVVGPGRRVLYLAIRPSHHPDVPREQDEKSARAEAIAAVRLASSTGLETLRERHRIWWHAYLSQAFVSLPDDPGWERFYWVQIYKFGCASRADVPIITDNLGPWYTKCMWAGTWWNLNVQLSYFPTFSGNRLDAGRSMLTAMDHYFQTGSMHVPGKPDTITVDRTSSYEGQGGVTYEIGNLTWVLHNYWRFWKYSMEEPVGRQLARLLKADVNYYLGVLIERNGKLHVPPSASPEYPGCPWEDTNYSLQLLRWALETLLDFNRRFDLRDPLEPKWRDTLARLTELPVNEHGLMVAPAQSFDTSHRHYSHLLAFYPLHTLNPDQGEQTAALLSRSLERWCSMEELWGIYSCSGSAAMYATLGEGDRALQQLDKMAGLNNSGGAQLLPNTMYAENGGPVIESPLSVVESIDYMLLQSWGDVIRVFPAMPGRWRNATYHNLRAEGAFLVSAKWREGKTAWISIRSLAGSACRIETEIDGFQVNGERDFHVRDIPGPGRRRRFEVDLRQGETVELVASRETTKTHS